MEVHLSDRHRRLICRMAFLVVCLLPTCLTIRAVLFPVSIAQWELAIRNWVGVPVAIGQVVTRTPQHTDFVDLKFGSDHFQFRVTVDQVSARNTAAGRLIHVNTITGSAEAIRDVLRRFDDRSSGGWSSDRPLQLQVDRVVILKSPEVRSDDFEIARVVAQIERPGDRWQIRFSGSGRNGESPFRISKTADTEQVSWQIDSGDTPVPGWVAGSFFPVFRTLGDHAGLTGQAVLFRRTSGWSGQIANLNMCDVDLARLVWHTFGQPLSGRAQIMVDSADMLDGRIHKLSGMVHCPVGTIGAELLNASQECAEMNIVSPWGGSDTPFQELAFRFRLSDYQISVSPVDNRDAILHSTDGGKILIPASGQPQPVANLLAMLAWPRHHSAPINRSTAPLAACLAWPPLPGSDRYSADSTGSEPQQQVGEAVWK